MSAGWTLADFRRHVPRIIAERDAALSEVEHLRGLVEDFQHGAAAFIADEIAPIQAERDAARATLARVEALHRPHTEKSGTIVCSGCLCVWPCFTEQLLQARRFDAVLGVTE